MSESQRGHSGTEGPPHLEPLKLNQEMYPYTRPSHQHQFLSSSARFEDDKADDIQPRYRMLARLRSLKNGAVLYEGEAFTAIGKDGTHFFGMRNPTCHTSGLGEYVVRLEGHLLDRPEFGVQSDNLLLTHVGDLVNSPDEPHLTGSLPTLVVSSAAPSRAKEIISRTHSIYVPLYNCMLPPGGRNWGSDYWAKPVCDPEPIETKWMGHDIHIGEFRLYMPPRQQALVTGVRGVPTAFLVFRDGDFQRDPLRWPELWDEIRRFVLAMSLAILSPIFVRFWEYRDRRQEPIARVHYHMREQSYSPGSALLADRGLLGSFLDKVGSSTGIVEVDSWWQAIFLLLESSRHHHEHGLGGLYEQYTAVFQCLEALISAKFRSNTKLMAMRAKYKRIREHAIIKGLSADILALEEALNIRVTAEPAERATFAQKTWRARTNVIHKGQPIQDPGPGLNQLDYDYLSLYQLHAARILLALTGYTGHFWVRHFLFNSRGSHTGYEMPLSIEQMREQDIRAYNELPAALAKPSPSAQPGED